MAKKVQFTTNQPGATTDYLAADNTWKTIPGGGGGVPYTGATADVDLGIHSLTADTIGIGTPAGAEKLHIDGGASTTRVKIDADNGVSRILSFRTDDVQRWALRVDGVESGSNSGADFQLRRYNDAGTFIDHPISINRSNGNITTSQNLNGATATEMGYLSGVTSSIQTQLNAKQDTITGAATTITTANLTASRALVSNGGGKVDVSAVTTTELGRLVGVTSDIQTQLNAKANSGTGTSFLTGNFGNGNLQVPISGTQYSSLQGGTLSNTEAIRVLVTPQDCTLSRLYFHTGTTHPATGTLVVTIRKNNADTSLVITIASGGVANFYSNLVNSVSFTSGDRCSVKVVNNASAPSATVVGISVMVTI